ncbi:B1148D12.12 [Oryza sativa (japonica cultivar-group)]
MAEEERGGDGSEWEARARVGVVVPQAEEAATPDGMMTKLEMGPEEEAIGWRALQLARTTISGIAALRDMTCERCNSSNGHGDLSSLFAGSNDNGPVPPMVASSALGTIRHARPQEVLEHEVAGVMEPSSPGRPSATGVGEDALRHAHAGIHPRCRLAAQNPTTTGGVHANQTEKEKTVEYRIWRRADKSDGRAAD